MAKPGRPEHKSEKFRLSYSGSTCLLECEQKFVYSRLQHLPIDADSEESHALAFGSAFHYVCETSLHCRVPEVPSITAEAIRLYELSNKDYPKLAACLSAYFRLHEASGLKVICCELEIYIEGYYLAYIDAVMQAADGGWWIVDLKTASKAMNTTFRRLDRDPQLNLYASYYKLVAEKLGLNPEYFQGCVYRTTIKPRLEPKAGESVRDYIARSNISSYSIYVRRSQLHIEETRDIFDRLHSRGERLSMGDAPLRNYGACANWMRPCEYWSQCHGTLYGETPIYHLHEAQQGREAPPSILPDETTVDLDWDW